MLTYLVYILFSNKQSPPPPPPLPTPSSPYISHKDRKICCKGRRPRNKKTKGVAENQRNVRICIVESRKPVFLIINRLCISPQVPHQSCRDEPSVKCWEEADMWIGGGPEGQETVKKGKWWRAWRAWIIIWTGHLLTTLLGHLAVNMSLNFT